MTLYKNTYRVESTRLKYWDYSNPGLYFITISTHYHQHYFGNIKNSKMFFTEQGNIVSKIWYKIADQFDNVILDEFVVMPNHVHGIIIITKNDTDKIGGRDAIDRISKINPKSDLNLNEHKQNKYGINLQSTVNINQQEADKDAINPKSDLNLENRGRDAINRVSTGRGGITGENNPMITKHSIGKIIRWYKGRCTFEIRKETNPGFKWQSRFFDHIIRNEKSYLKIKEYIRYNPNRWEDDKYYEHQ